MEFPSIIYLFPYHIVGRWEARARLKTGHYITALGETPNIAVNNLGEKLEDKCNICHDYGYRYDNIKLKSVKCECQK